MNNGLLGWPGSRKVLQQMCATNNTGIHRQFFTSSTTWVVPTGVTRIRASALGGGGAGSSGGLPGDDNSGSGGGGGLFLRGDLNVTPGEALTITVGTGGAGALGSGASGGSSMITQAGRTVIIAGGGNGATNWNTPAPDQTAFYFDGIPLVVVPGKGGGAGSSPAVYSGSGGGGGGLSAKNTAGTAYTTNYVSGSGSMGIMTPGAPNGAVGIAPPLGLPESGSGGGCTPAILGGVGNAGAQGAGGGGGSNYVAGGNGGNGFVLVEY